ncbi:hypothetical protein JTE90_005324 [Oedothorax gibbosus]|uniref:DUF4219 domain-containing protein n=1 Tax=Oedothorax gibbosus TaxID=931172 RepID=A0AAV6UK19_9ARAC|nr:hypothetical protein JTE90_005324 [Oedothorax gibbosus]
MEVSQIEKLDASNYGAWKEDVRVLLMERNCWRITSGEEKYPTEVEPDEKSTPVEDPKIFVKKLKKLRTFLSDGIKRNQKQVPSSNKSVTIKPVTKTDEHNPRGRKSRPKGRQPQSKGRRTPSFSRQRDKPPHQTSYVIHALLTEGQADKEGMKSVADLAPHTPRMAKGDAPAGAHGCSVEGGRGHDYSASRGREGRVMNDVHMMIL